MIEISFPEAVASGLQTLDIALDILYEDSDLLVVNKPAGLVVHPGAGHLHDTLVNALLAHTKDLSMKFGEDRPGIVHRLDRDTSGLLVVAKNDFAHEKLVLQFKNRNVHRIYFAGCLGIPAKPQGRIQSFLARHPVDRMRYASVLGADKKQIRDPEFPSQTGRWSITNYWTLKKTGPGLSYLKLKLETGRTHQIRVHLSEMGCPILGDTLYGAARKLNSIKSVSAREVIGAIPRMALHAAELGFIHPTTGKDLFFSVHWPADISQALKALELINESE